MELISYQDALAKGLTTYFTGKPCKYGHVSERYVRGCKCGECSRIVSRSRIKEWTAKNPERYAAYQKKYRAENREQIRAQQKVWRDANLIEIKRRRKENNQRDPERQKRARKRRYAKPEYRAKAQALSKVWRDAHREEYRLQMKEYRRNNREAIDAKIAEWKRNNPERHSAHRLAAAHNRRERNIEVGPMSHRDILAVRTRKRCEACRTGRGPFEVDHRVALSKGGSNHLSNLQLLCRPCNRSKGSKDQIAWAQEQGRLL